MTSDDTGSALVVYVARLREGAEPEPDPVKVAELAWVNDPTELGAQVSADTLAAWEAVVRSRAERGEKQEA